MTCKNLVHRSFYSLKSFDTSHKTMLLKFWNRDGEIILDSKRGEMIDITSDRRTKMLNKREMTEDRFKIDEGVYFLRKPFFVQMGKKQNRESIEALLIHYEGKKIIITGNGAHVFYNGKALDVEDYDVAVDEAQGMQIAAQS